MDARLNANGKAIRELNLQFSLLHTRLSLQTHFELVVTRVHIYTSYFDLVYVHVRYCRASFVSYKTSMYSAISSFSSGFVQPSFLTADQLAAIVKKVTKEEIRRGTKLTPAIQVGFEVTYYEVKLVLEVSVLQEGLSIVSGIPMNSKSSTIDIYRAIPLHQLKKDVTTASVYSFTNKFLAIVIDTSQYAEIKFQQNKVVS